MCCDVAPGGEVTDRVAVETKWFGDGMENGFRSTGDICGDPCNQ